jgi:hypothetical protein
MVQNKSKNFKGFFVPVNTKNLPTFQAELAVE